MAAVKLARQQDLLLIPLLKLVLENLSADPSGRPAGAVYWNTTSSKVRVYTGGAWADLAGSTMTAAEVLAALVTVDGAGSGLDADVLDGQQGTYYTARANHSGTQAASTISDFNSAVDARVALVVDSAPGALDTLNELAAAIGDDANFATTVTNSIAGKADTYLTATFGDGSASTFNIANPSSNADAIAICVNASNGANEYDPEIIVGSSTIDVNFTGYIPTADQFKLRVIG